MTFTIFPEYTHNSLKLLRPVTFRINFFFACTMTIEEQLTITSEDAPCGATVASNSMDVEGTAVAAGVAFRTATSKDEDDAHHHQHHHHNQESYTSVMQGLVLNMDEPWERSLSRLLEEVVPNEYHQMMLYDNTMSLITSPTSTVDHQRNIGAPELMLLGRTESRDYALEIESNSTTNLTMDDTSSVVSSDKTTTNRSGSPKRQFRDSIYRRNSRRGAKGQATGRKSLFDDSDGDSDDTEGSRKCRLVHKFSNDSLYIVYDQQQMEDRGEQEDDSERRMEETQMNHKQKRTFSILKASAVHDDKGDIEYFESHQLLIPEQPSRQHRRSMSAQSLPML
jgi:hypothetical protein